jgi:uncharacterized metal-binding protein
MNSIQSNCVCSTSIASTLIFSCSGAADVGELADLAARKLTQEGAGKMFCLAGIGGRVSGILKSTEAAASILVIDGCPLNCAKKTLEEAGFKQLNYICLTDLGLEKGKTDITAGAIASVIDRAKTYL